MPQDLIGKVVKKLRLPTVDYSKTPRQVVQAQEDDANSRFLSIELYDDRGVVDLSIYNECNFVVQYTRGNKEHTPAEISKDENKIYCKLTSPMLKEEGSLTCEIRLVGKDSQNDNVFLTSQQFYVAIGSSIYDETVPQGDDRVILLDDLIASVNALDSSILTEEQIRRTNEAVRIANEIQRSKNYSEARDMAETALTKATSVEQKANSGQFNGKGVIIRYSKDANGTGMTEKWTTGQKYMGIYWGNVASTNPSDYTWLLFVGSTFCLQDASSGIINYLLEDNTDKTFVSNNISSLTLTIPSNVYHGFYSGVNFKTRSTGTSFNLVNNSGYELILTTRGNKIDQFNLGSDSTVMLVVSCDGLVVRCDLAEV